MEVEKTEAAYKQGRKWDGYVSRNKMNICSGLQFFLAKGKKNKKKVPLSWSTVLETKLV